MNLSEDVFCLGLVIPGVPPNVAVPIKSGCVPQVDAWLSARSIVQANAIALFNMRCIRPITASSSSEWIKKLESTLASARVLQVATTSLYAALGNQTVSKEQYVCLSDRANMPASTTAFVYDWMSAGWLFDVYTRNRQPVMVESVSRQKSFKSVSAAFEMVAVDYCVVSLLSQLAAAQTLAGDYDAALDAINHANEHAIQVLKTDLSLHVPSRAACDIINREPMLLAAHFWKSFICKVVQAQHAHAVHLQSRLAPLTNSWFLFNTGRHLIGVALNAPYSVVDEPTLAKIFATCYVTQTEALVRLGRMYAPLCKKRIDPQGLALTYVLLFERGTASMFCDGGETSEKVLISLDVLDPTLAKGVKETAEKMRACISEIKVSDDATESNMSLNLSDDRKTLLVSALG
jgi:hypothetical protein